MEQLSKSSPIAGTPVEMPAGFAAGTLVETESGWRDVAELKAGGRLRDSEGRYHTVTAVEISDETDHWVDLPGDIPGESLRVAGFQLMSCRHFLCAALFGTRQAVFFAGDVRASFVARSAGKRQRFYRPVAERDVTIALCSYEFLSISSRGLPAAKAEWRASDGASGDGGSHHPSVVSDRVEPLARAFLRPAETAQLCESGVLFRHAVLS